MYFENWKSQIFDKSASRCLTRYKKILWGGSFGCKKILKFTCLTMKFHNLHHTNGTIFTFLGRFGIWGKLCYHPLLSIWLGKSFQSWDQGENRELREDCYSITKLCYYTLSREIFVESFTTVDTITKEASYLDR